MIAIREGYGPEGRVLAYVNSKAEAKEWAAGNGYGLLSVQMRADEIRVAPIYNPLARL